MTEKQLKVLIAEDEDDLREVVVYQFEQRGCRVFEARTGDAAYEIIQRECPDIIFSDIRMPEGTGVELLRRIRRVTYPEGRGPDVYIMTGLLEKGESYLKALGVREIFLKPFDIGKTVQQTIAARLKTEDQLF